MSGGAEHPAGRSTIERKEASLRHDPAQAMRRLQRHDAPPPRAFAHIQLHALCGAVTQRRQDRAGRISQGESCGGRMTEPDEPEPQHEATIAVASHETVILERDRQTVGRSPGQIDVRVEFAERHRTASLQGVKDRHRFVENPDTTYTVH